MSEMKSTLSKIGFVSSKADPCFYIMAQENRIRVVLIIYVDDCIIAGEPQYVQNAIERISQNTRSRSLDQLRNISDTRSNMM